jgi:hypothetical protein
LGQRKNIELTLKTWKGRSNEAKRKVSQRNIEKGYQKPLGHPLILRACLHVEHPRLEFPTKKEKACHQRGQHNLAKETNQGVN